MSRRHLPSVLATALAIGFDTTLCEPGHRLKPRAMKFGQPLFTSELSGSTGGITAAAARGGVNYFRVRRRPGNPRSTEQSRIRSILAAVAAAWVGTLTIAQRAAWAGLAGASESGIDVYTACNTALLQGGGTRQDTAPSSRNGTWTPPGALTVSAATGTWTVDAISATDDWNSAAGGVLNIYVGTGQQQASRLSQQYPFRWGESQVRAGAAITAANVATAIEAAVDAVLPGVALVAGRVLYIRLDPVAANGKTAVGTVYRVTVSA